LLEHSVPMWLKICPAHPCGIEFWVYPPSFGHPLPVLFNFDLHLIFLLIILVEIR
jgi:hypothetical protein